MFRIFHGLGDRSCLHRKIDETRYDDLMTIINLIQCTIRRWALFLSAARCFSPFSSRWRSRSFEVGVHTAYRHIRRRNVAVERKYRQRVLLQIHVFFIFLPKIPPPHFLNVLRKFHARSQPEQGSGLLCSPWLDQWYQQFICNARNGSRYGSHFDIQNDCSSKVLLAV